MQYNQTEKTNLTGAVSALIGNSIFGFSFMFSRIALQSASPFVMLAYRFLFAFLFINLVTVWARKTKKDGWLRFNIDWKRSAPLFLLGLIQPVLYFLCESYGIDMTNATVSGVIIALVPIVALAAGFVFMKEAPGIKRILFSLLSIAGVIVMTLQQSAGGDIRFLGIILLFGAVVSGTSYNILSRKLSKAFSALERTYVMMLTACVSFLLLAVFENLNTPDLLLSPLSDQGFLLSILYLSLLSSILAFLCLNHSATLLPVSKTTAFCNVTTVLSVFAGVVFLKESISFVSVLAAIVIIVGVFGVQKT